MPLLPHGAHAPGSVPRALDGHLMLQVKRIGPAPFDDVSPVDGGLVFCGLKAAENKAAVLRDRPFSGPVLIDPSAYEKHVATPDRPFAAGEASLMAADGLEEQLERQRMQGATLAVTPTALLSTGDLESLEAVAERALEIGDDDVLLSLPVDARWLRAPHHHDLISMLRQVPLPKALVLCATHDPLSTAEAAANLREVVASVPGIGLLRSDLAALDAMVHGAGFASIGDSASARHGPTPGRRGPGPRRRDPAVLLPRAVSYHYGETIATAFEGADAPLCPCGACREWGAANGSAEGRRPLTTFTDAVDTGDAHRHNHAVWSALWEWIMRAADEADAKDRWLKYCRRALSEIAELNEDAGRPGRTFEPSVALRVWAGGDLRRGRL